MMVFPAKKNINIKKNINNIRCGLAVITMKNVKYKQIYSGILAEYGVKQKDLAQQYRVVHAIIHDTNRKR